MHIDQDIDIDRKTDTDRHTNMHTYKQKLLFFCNILGTSV